MLPAPCWPTNAHHRPDLHCWNRSELSTFHRSPLLKELKIHERNQSGAGRILRHTSQVTQISSDRTHRTFLLGFIDHTVVSH